MGERHGAVQGSREGPGGLRDATVLLFYLHPGAKEGTWRVLACHRSTMLTDAADDLKFLRGLPGSARGNRVSGTVRLLVDRQTFGGVRVRAIGRAGSYETVTDNQGVYEFGDLKPGTYTIRIDYPKETRLHGLMLFGVGRRADLFPDSEDAAQLDVTAESGNGIDFHLVTR